MITQYAMGTASTFLSAYTLATLHQVSTVAQAPAFQLWSIAHAGHRLVGDREWSEAEWLALPSELVAFEADFEFDAMYGGSTCLSRASAFAFEVSPHVLVVC